MDITFRTWLIIIGGIVILAILLDGVRRSRKDKLPMDSKSGSSSEPEDDLDFLRSELPNGGARVRKASDDSSPGQESSAKSINLDEEVPVLMESVAMSKARPVVKPAEPEEPVREESSEEEASIDECESVAEELSEEELEEAVLIETSLVSKIEQLMQIDASAELLDEREPAKDVIAVNVVAKGMKGFEGPELIHILLACDMRFGDKDIFHRYESPNGSGKLQFSMANVMEPGTFDLTNPDKIQTRGLSFFMGLPGPKDTLAAFDAMAEIAYVIARNLGGEVRDDSHSVMTPQTLEHYRQRIKDFERKQLSLKIN